MSLKFSTRFPFIKKKKSHTSIENIPVQRVIIPQGMINPSEVTIIEIPEEMQDVPAVIARPLSYGFDDYGDDSYSTFSPVTCSSVRDSILFPKDSNASASLGASQYSISACSSPRSRPAIQARSNTACAGECWGAGKASSLKSKSFPRTGYPRPELYEAGVTYGGMGYDYTPNRSGSFYQNLRKRTAPPIAAKIGVKSKSFPRPILPNTSQMYAAGVTYGGMPCDFSPDLSGTFYKDYIQDYTSIVGPHNESEETGYDYSCPERRAKGFDPYVHVGELKRQFSQYMDFDPTVCSTPQGYQQSVDSFLNAMDYSVPEPCEPSYLVPKAPAFPYKRQRTGREVESSESRITPTGLKKVLDNLDIVELSRIQKDLRNFQIARRQLLFDATNLKH